MNCIAFSSFFPRAENLPEVSSVCPFHHPAFVKCLDAPRRAFQIVHVQQIYQQALHPIAQVAGKLLTVYIRPQWLAL
jgi:hypothetical protein